MNLQIFLTTSNEIDFSTNLLCTLRLSCYYQRCLVYVGSLIGTSPVMEIGYHIFPELSHRKLHPYFGTVQLESSFSLELGKKFYKRAFSTGTGCFILLQCQYGEMDITVPEQSKNGAQVSTLDPFQFRAQYVQFMPNQQKQLPNME